MELVKTIMHRYLLRYLDVGFLKDYYQTFFFVLFTVLWLLLYMAVNEVWWGLKYFWTSRTYEFKPDDWPKKFHFQGGVHNKDGMLVVTQSSSGCIVANRNWKNFNANFDFSVEEDGVFGFVFRAQDLENYFMLQFDYSSTKLKLTPHIKVNGSWDLYSIPIDVDFPQIQSICSVRVTLNKCHLFVYWNNLLLADYYLPTNYHFKIKQEDQGEGDMDTLRSLVIRSGEIIFRSYSGSVGFRCFGVECIKLISLKVVPIRWWSR